MKRFSLTEGIVAFSAAILGSLATVILIAAGWVRHSKTLGPREHSIPG